MVFSALSATLREAKALLCILARILLHPALRDIPSVSGRFYIVSLRTLCEIKSLLECIHVT
jgi:hypothetical protein